MPAREPQDPLDAILRPPIDESPEEKELRLAKEAEALRISHEIDEQIKREKVQRKKKHLVRLLLLGQSESGALPPSQLSCLSSHIYPCCISQESLRHYVVSCLRSFPLLPREYEPTVRARRVQEVIVHVR